jgi:2-polyprenyl-3-methyl-5-hydroxy-6-metoxy-1,4-benzoquinol methylase
MRVTRHPETGREVRAFGGRRLFGGKDVLDVGSGDGRLSFDLAAVSRRVVGIEPNEELIAIARAEAARRGLDDRLDFRLGDGRYMDTGVLRERFDIAVFTWSL